MRKYYYFIAGLGIFVIILLIIGFSLTGTPYSLQNETKDQQRISDFSYIQKEINSYYQTNNELPQRLNLVSSLEKLQDPYSHTDYVYQIDGKNSYKLCTTFATDTLKSKSDRARYNYAIPSQAHSKGYYCLTYLIPSYLIKTLSPTPSAKTCKGEWVAGECLSTMCQDSDGDNIYKKGSVVYKLQDNENFDVLNDFCANTNQIYERVCELSQKRENSYVIINNLTNCPNGCLDGACKQ